MKEILFITDQAQIEIYETDLVIKLDWPTPSNLSSLIPEENTVYYIAYLQDCQLIENEISGTLYLGVGSQTREGQDSSLWANVHETINLPLAITNFCAVTELEQTIFKKNKGWVTVESAENLIFMIKELMFKPYIALRKPIKEQVYPTMDSENHLSLYSQKNQHCRRATGYFDAQDKRGEFQRDYERIVHSSAYRKLVDKAQIFTASKGDQYRTRMTHTMEVNQIARAISLALNLNTHLTEAIAIGHDLGHTPFGHQGERTLDAILKNRIPIIPGDFSQNPFGGFKHNFQGLRVLQKLEERYAEFEGLDISYQVLEGILKHTGGRIQNCSNCTSNCDCKCFNLHEMLEDEDIPMLFPDYPFSTTLEGQVVAIADEIAQRSHDLDDAFAAGALTVSELIQRLHLQSARALSDRLEKIQQNITIQKAKHRFYANESQLHQGRIVSMVIRYFIDDVIHQSEENIKNYTPNLFFKENHRFDTQLIQLSLEGEKLCCYLEKIVSRKVINAQETVQFDHKAAVVTEGLFRLYYNNPKLLPFTVQRQIFIAIRKHTPNIIDLNDGDLACINEELRRITAMPIPPQAEKRTPTEEEYWMKRKILVRAIADWISGMTDSFALKAFHQLYEI